MQEISFIVPIYNCAQYLKNGIDSIISVCEGRCCYEIILIDDGSSDESLDICHEYGKNFEFVHVFHQTNMGPSTARNYGLYHAKGDFVWFVDADDTIEPAVVPILMDTIRKSPQADMITFQYNRCYAHAIVPCETVKKTGVLNGGEFLASQHAGLYLWNHVFRRESILKPFIDGLYHIEDFCFIVLNAIHYEMIVALPTIGYNYNQTNQVSISRERSVIKSQQANRDAFAVYREIFAEQRDLHDEGRKKVLQDILCFGIAAHLFTMMKESSSEEVEGYIKKYRDLGLYPVGKTKNRRANAFLCVANRKWLMVLLARIYGNRRKKRMGW